MIARDTTGGIQAKWAIVNLLWVALLTACWHQGWLSYVFEKDVTYISHGIAVVGFITLILSYWKTRVISKLLKNPEAVRSKYLSKIFRVGEIGRTDIREAFKTELVGYVSSIEFIATSALAVGVLGTVIGLVMGFSTLEPSDIANVENAGPAVAQLLKGLSVAFHTTLVGGLVNLWLRTNHFLLMQGNASLFSKVMGG